MSDSRCSALVSCFVSNMRTMERTVTLPDMYRLLARILLRRAVGKIIDRVKKERDRHQYSGIVCDILDDLAWEIERDRAVFERC